MVGRIGSHVRCDRGSIHRAIDQSVDRSAPRSHRLAVAVFAATRAERPACGDHRSQLIVIAWGPVGRDGCMATSRLVGTAPASSRGRSTWSPQWLPFPCCLALGSTVAAAATISFPPWFHYSPFSVYVTRAAGAVFNNGESLNIA